MRVMCDTNIILDVLLDREPFANFEIPSLTPEDLLQKVTWK